MNDIDQIQASKVTLQDLYRYNQFVYYESNKQNSIGKAYSTPFFIEPEKFQNNDPWDYNINSYGFRSNDWTFEKTPAFFGCSCVFGIGVKTPASDIVRGKLGVKSIPNLGSPGVSLANIIKLFAAFVKLHPVSEAFIIIPPITRVLLPTYNDKDAWQLVNYLPNYVYKNDKKFHKKVFQVLNDNVAKSYAVDYIDWANLIAKDNDIKIHWGAWEKDTYKFLKSAVDTSFYWSNPPNMLARDGAHPGQEAHQLLAEKCISLL
jgi:hypothetical protein|tara:strand:+ start:77 stop:859 length:783 start_codon:yes stop_codon:yes gene_type:complete